MTATEPLGPARQAFGRRDWVEAHARFLAAARERPLEPDDIERLAIVASLLGRDEESAATWERAYREWLCRGDLARAARCGFWLAFGLLNRGEAARGTGWLAKARRQLDRSPRECAEQGYFMLPGAVRQLHEGDHAGGLATSRAAAELAERCGDEDLLTFARCVQGRALLRLGRAAEGMALLDEVMVTVLADEIFPVLAGSLYCTVIEGCQEVLDLGRAREWTAALTRWCEAQPDLVLYRGQCLVHRTEILLLHGDWHDAADAADQAYDRLTRPPGHPAAGEAAYLRAEQRRLRGAFDKAEEAYRDATRLGRQPQPGLARLRLAQGRLGDAKAAVTRALGEASVPATRWVLLAAAVDVLIAAGDTAAAAAAAEELRAGADEAGVPLLHAAAGRAHGAVLLAEGDVSAAAAALRGAWAWWQDIGAPYEAARTRVLLGQACRAAGDDDTARMEFDAAGSVFARLGAGPDLAAVEALSGAASAPADRAAAAGLTVRETEVLRLVAAGKSNRAIAADLFLSEKTVARHVSNILTKIGRPSRAAATAYAYEHGLV